MHLIFDLTLFRVRPASFSVQQVVLQRLNPVFGQVRARARQTYTIVNGTAPPPTVLADVPTAVTSDSLMTLLMHERRVELALEDSYRYDDLVRWHRAGLITLPNAVTFGFPESNANWQPRNLLKPVPQRELDVNPNLKQNTGY